MYKLMLREVSRLSKGFAALNTNVIFFVSVDTFVHIKTLWLYKCFATFLTYVIFLTRVKEHVLFEVL